ncbi:MAG: prepilin-type N-terminal cleavage/methylation domain-containing protein [Proteobacteria bacterium]|nr:prepilin-type N-terminal cleavage/methylation domain-containing protein [Pseudomonadota bacterium]
MFDKKMEESDKKFNNRGFTLIEILIALAIFSIGILGVASMQILSVNYNGYARRTTEATTIVSELIERTMTLPYDANDLDPANSPQQVMTGIYTVTWNVTDNVDNKTINMTVSWPERRTTKSIVLNYIKPQDI